MIIAISNRRSRCLIRPAFITTNDGDNFEATYKGYTIRIEKQGPPRTGSKWYSWVTHPDGTYIVDGWFDLDTMDEVLKMCMENIHWKPKEA